MQNRKRLIASTKRVKDSYPDREVVETAVERAMKMGATDAITSLSRLDKSQVKFANSEVVVTQAWSEVEMEIYLAFGKRVVSSSLNDLARLDSVLTELKASSKKTPKNDDYRGIAEGRFKYKAPPFDRKIVRSEDELIDLTWKGIEAAEAGGADRCAGVLHRYHTKSVLASSGVGIVEDEVASVNYSIRAFGKGGGSGHAVSCSTAMHGLDTVGAGREAAALCMLAQRPKPGFAGKMPVIFTPLAGADMPLHVAQFASATRVDAGLSFLRDKVGKTVGSEALTIVDDGTRPDGMGTRSADDEGLPTRRTDIVMGGKLVTYLHNTSTSRKHKAKNTANAGLMSPRPWNVVVPPGDMTRDELLEEMGNGLVVTNVWYSRFQNYSTGDYSTIPRDAILVVKKGEIVGSTKGVRISDNMLRMMQGVRALGKAQKQVYWWEMEINEGAPTFVPDMLVDGVNITKSTN